MAAAFKAARVQKDNKGQFCSKHTLKRRKNLSDVMKNKWSVNDKENLEMFVSETSVKHAFQLSGRRVVELGILAEELDGGCRACNTPLKLSNCIDETVSGLGSFLYIVCSNSECGEINVCHTNKMHRVAGKLRGRPIFDVNTKLAAGMLHAGMGPTHVNAMLSSMNVPVIGESTLKAREREIGPAIEEVAKSSCREGMQEEKEKWELESQGQDSGKTSIGVSYDMGWQKRGKGHNSLTGVGSMIGIKTGKVIGYGTRTKRCAICEVADRNTKQARQHDCRLNWSGSSKAMEADVCADLAQTCSAKHNTQVTILVGDDDSSTIKKVRETVDHEVEKWSDIVHAKRSFGSALYSLQPKHKRNRNISAKVIEYLQRCFIYALKQNKDNPDGVKSSLGAIIPHAFGCHGNCNISWCGYLKDPSNYSHASLPYGRDLQGDSLKQDLQEIVNIYINNAEKLAPLGSSQANEALNNTIGSKAPKIRHYASSESNDYRVACAVSQKNIGHSYVAQALQKIQLSPGAHCKKHSQKIDRKITQLRARENTREFKRKRRTRKEQRLTKNKQLDTREGPQYETGLGYRCQDESGEEIPPPAQPPENKEVSLPKVNTKVVFDLETSSRGNNTEILQIAATDGSEEFNVYVLPRYGISPAASAVNKLTFLHGTLFCDGRPVTAVQISNALKEFISWLQPKAPCLLLAHNAKSFDAKHLMRTLGENNLSADLKEVVLGFSDTLPAFRELLPERNSHSQENLAKDLLGGSYDAHNALADVQTLHKLTSKFLNTKLLIKHSFTTPWITEHAAFLNQKRDNLGTLQPLIIEKAISVGMASKAAASGLRLQHLKLAFQRGGVDGLSHILREKFNGKSRVTTNRRIITQICKYFQSK